MSHYYKGSELFYFYERYDIITRIPTAIKTTIVLFIRHRPLYINMCNSSFEAWLYVGGVGGGGYEYDYGT